MKFRVAHIRPIRAIAVVSLITGGLVAGPFAGVAHAAPATFVVNTAGNAADTFVDGNCDTSATAGLQCTLRGAIQEANGNAGIDTIQFAMVAPYRITLNASGLPQITSPVTIDGTSQTGYNPTGGVIVRIDGVSNTTGLTNGLDVTTGGSGTTIKGLEIVRFNAAGVRLNADNNVVSGNYIGTTAANTVNCAAGVSCSANVGVVIEDGSNNTIGGTGAADRNILSNNNSYGAWITTVAGGASNNKIQGNYVGTTVDGSAALPNAYGIVIGSGGGTDPTGTLIGGTVAGARNVISGNSNNGIDIGYGATTIAGNYVGLNAAGTAAVPNNGTSGVYIAGSTTSVTLGGPTTASRNVISGNGQEGFEVSGPTAPITVTNNYIGTNPAGTTAIGNTYDGIYAYYTDDLVIDSNLISANQGFGDELRVDSGAGATITNNVVGLAADGITALAAAATGISLNNTVDTTVTNNVIAGHASAGITGSSTDGLVVTDNKVGTDTSGMLDRGNGTGIAVSSSTELTIGTPGHGNVIAGNDMYGIHVYSDHDGVIQGNLIGTDASGGAALANGASGIWLNNVSHVTVGGTATGAGNVIGASGVGCCEAGIYFSSADDNVVLGNRIGVGSSGGAVPNNWAGVYLDGGSDSNQIGSTVSGGGNVIANSADAGVLVAANGVGNEIRGNSIRDNGALGIDLNQDGVSPNDSGDRDFGANRVQNFPVLTTSASNGSGTQVSGTLSSRASRSYGVDFFANTACDGSGNGEGATYLGSTTVTTNGSGNASFQATLAGVAPAGSEITATATDSALGDTSEFSACLANQGGLPSASVANASASENAGNVSFTVSLSSAPVFAPVTVQYATSDATATSPADYTSTSGTVTFNAGETTKNVNVPVVNDALDENNETFTLTLSSPTNAVLTSGGDTATGTIQDDDAAPTVSIGNATAASEPDTPNTVNQTYAVSLSAPSALPVTVIAHTVPGTATENVDYQGTAAQLSFAPGQTAGTFTVVVNGDNTDEFNENYTARLGSPTNAVLGTSSGTGVINDNDAPPNLTVGDVAAAEGNSGGTTFAFTVSLSAPSEKSVHVVLSTANGTAKSTLGDYNAKTNSSMNIARNQISKVFKVTVVGDTTPEPNETFFVNVNVPLTTNCTVTDPQGQGTILNDD